jgi:cytochrome c oxidase cbb3-type subunit I/II
LIGSLVELVPFVTANKYIDNAYNANVKTIPYTPLAQAGRDIYVREGCYLCHTQMIRKLPFEVVRYGAASTMEESRFDHPHQWGSKRTGPDLARVGGKYPHLWHYRHMLNPQEVVSQSIMPAYAWLAKNKVVFETLSKKLAALKKLGVPYSDAEVQNAASLARAEAELIVADLKANGAVDVKEEQEIVALIAYLQFLGKQTMSVNEGGSQ